MPRIMLVIASVRPGRVGKPVGDWVASHLERDDVELDIADLAELALPFMDEPKHPRLRDYRHEHTKAWSERVDAADAFVFVTPEYNHSYAPALKNALDYLLHEWRGKSVAFVSYGGVSAGTRGVAALGPVLMALGLTAIESVHIPNVAPRVRDGSFSPADETAEAMARVADGVVAAAAQRVLHR